MQGGFKDGWLKEDLPTVQDTVYRRGTVKVVADRAELLASQIGAPELATIALAATGAGAAVLNYDYILEFIGVTGLLVTFAMYAFEFSSVEDLLVDIEGNVGSAVDAVNKIKNKL
mmetsp:Transcript_1681/g.5283  ORF Transcript_1681/g.5283 Transcript_1681/m.5283 type:complete len:115 (+) Transcript_1681:1870-2214(+)